MDLIEFIIPSKKEDINAQDRMSEYIKQEKSWNMQVLPQVITADIMKQIVYPAGSFAYTG